METSQKTNSSLWIAIFLVSLTAFTLGFFLSIQDEQARFSELDALSQSHLIYALQLKDDMAVIDWSKDLEKLPSMVVFQVKSPTKLIAQGGNQNLYPISAPTGLSFHFPYQWISHTSFTVLGTSIEMTAVFQDPKGPLFWGFCCFVLIWVMGFVAVQLKPKPTAVSIPLSRPSETGKTKPSPQAPSAQVDPQSSSLVLDKDYLIRQVTDKASQALDREAAELAGCHFLDLLPDPSVMKAISEGRETKLLKPFPSHPHLSATLQPRADGVVLFLENGEGTERA